MATFLELRNRVLRRVIDAPTAVQTEVPALVNAAIRKAEKRHDYAVMKQTAAYVTNETRVLGAQPADFKRFRKYPYWLEQNGQFHRIRYATDRQQPEQNWTDVDTGAPRIISRAVPDIMNTMNLLVYPVPDGLSDYSDGQYRVYVPYYRYLPALSADGDENWFCVNGDDYIVDEATGDAFDLNWDEKRAQYWHDKAREHYRDLRRADTAFVLGGMDLFVPFADVDEPDITE